MLGLFAYLTLALAAQDPGQWQDFGTGPDGVGVSVNLDSIERGSEGAQAMVRLRHARPTAAGATAADILTSFDCASRAATRREMGELRASGEHVMRSDEGVRMPPIQVPATGPMAEVRELVCSLAGD